MPTEIKLLHAMWIGGKPRQVDDVAQVDHATAKYLEGLGRAEIIMPTAAVEEAPTAKPKREVKARKKDTPADPEPLVETPEAPVPPVDSAVEIGDLLSPLDAEAPAIPPVDPAP